MMVNLVMPPARESRDGCSNALTHAIEGYITPCAARGRRLNALQALKAIEIIAWGAAVRLLVIRMPEKKPRSGSSYVPRYGILECWVSGLVHPMAPS